jgi:hypothetical protein
MMYAMLILLLPATFYAMSYAKYNWGRRNKKAAFGLVLMALAAVTLPVMIILAN